MPDPPAVSPEHRERRASAHERAAAAYEHVADVHEHCADVMDELDRPAQAEEQRRAARDDRDRAAVQWGRAAAHGGAASRPEPSVGDPPGPDSAPGKYLIRGGVAGRERLRILSRVMEPTTRVLFARVGIPADAACLDVGCGGGDVTKLLAELAPDGSVLGVDIDETKLELAVQEAADAGLHHVRFRLEDVTEPAGPGAADETFDVIYARFVLTHLVDPARAVDVLASKLVPGGVLIVEDIDFSGSFCHPESPAFRSYVALYSAAARARGTDPDIGPRLPGLLAEAGLAEVDVNVVQPAGIRGDVKVVSPITLEAIADSVLAAGLTTADELHATIEELDAFAHADGTLMSVPRIVQAWGRAAAH